jgi:death-on-curing protein
VDGNKRVALVAARTFLRLNGCDLNAPQEEKVAAVLEVAAGATDEAETADWVRRWLERPG